MYVCVHIYIYICIYIYIYIYIYIHITLHYIALLCFALYYIISCVGRPAAPSRGRAAGPRRPPRRLLNYMDHYLLSHCVCSRFAAGNAMTYCVYVVEVLNTNTYWSPKPKYGGLLMYSRVCMCSVNTYIYIYIYTYVYMFMLLKS